MDELRVRQRDDVVLFNRIFLALMTTILGIGVLSAAAGGLWWFVPIAVSMGCAVGVWVMRTERIGLIAEGDRLEISDLFRTRRVDRSEIKGIAVSIDPWYFRGRSLAIETIDGREIWPSALRPVRQFGERPDLDRFRSLLEAWFDGDQTE